MLFFPLITQMENSYDRLYEFFHSLCDFLNCVEAIHDSVINFAKYVPYFQPLNVRTLIKANKHQKIVSERKIQACVEASKKVGAYNCADIVSQLERVKLEEDPFRKKDLEGNLYFFSKELELALGKIELFSTLLPVVQTLGDKGPRNYDDLLGDLSPLIVAFLECFRTVIGEELKEERRKVGLSQEQINLLFLAIRN